MTSHLSRIAAALMLAAALSACGGPATDESGSTHNAADVTFARDMIPHHQQAVDMAAMVPGHTTNPALRLTASHIGADQRAEIQTLTRLLALWNEPVAPHHGGHGDHTGMNGMDMTGPGMTGMVDQATLAQLQTLTGGAFDTLWAQSMIGHHKGAVAMAQTEIADGQNSDAIQMSRLIVTTQQREIAYLNHLVSATE